MKVFTNLAVISIYKDYVALKYRGMSRSGFRSVDYIIGVNIDLNGHVVNYDCCNEHETLEEAMAEADKTIIPFKPSTIWR